MCDNGLSDMTLKCKKNLVWAGILIIACACVLTQWRRGQLEEQEREHRRLFNAQAMREAGLSGNVVILDGTESLELGIISDAVAKIHEQLNQKVDAGDVAMWVGESNVQMILTSDRLYCLRNGTVFQWNLSELKVADVDWERKTGGAVFIGGQIFYVFVDCRKPLTDRLKRVLSRYQSEL